MTIIGVAALLALWNRGWDRDAMHTDTTTTRACGFGKLPSVLAVAWFS